MGWEFFGRLDFRFLFIRIVFLEKFMGCIGVFLSLLEFLYFRIVLKSLIEKFGEKLIKVFVIFLFSC